MSRQMETPQMWEERHKRESEEIADILEVLDAVAHHVELKFGYDVLDKVPDDLREKFLRQKKLANEAIKSGDVNKIGIQCNSLTKGWHAVDKAAEGTMNSAFEDETVKAVLNEFPGATVSNITPFTS